MSQKRLDNQWPYGRVALSLAAICLLGCGPSGTDTETPGSEDVTDTAALTPTSTASPTASSFETEEPTETLAASGGFTLTSPTFAEGETYPSDYTCERDGGGGNSPPLSWSNAPVGTEAFAVTMHHYPDGSDPAKDDPNSYWLLWNLPGETTELSAGNVEGLGTEGSDKDGVETGYTPPCSPGDVVHEYSLTVYALSEDPLTLGNEDTLEVDWAVMMQAIEPLTLESASLTFVN